MKEKVLKDVTNMLEADPINFKPAWSGPRVGGGNFFGEGIISKGKTQLMRAHPNVAAASKEAGLGVLVGPNTARPPDINQEGRESLP